MNSLKLAMSALIASTCFIMSLGAPLTDGSCHQAVDIVFLVDTSSSIYTGDFNNYVKPFINDIVGSFGVGSGPQDARVGLVLFSHRAYLQFYLRSYKTTIDVQRAVNRTRFRGGDTHTHKGLELTSRIMLNPRYGARPGVPKVVIVLTDGKSYDETRTIKEAHKIKSMGVDIFAIGVGSKLDAGELRAMASKPAENYAFNVTNFEALATIKKKFTQSTCLAIKTTAAPTTMPTTRPQPTTTTTTTTPSTTTTTTPTTTTTTTTPSTTTPTTTTPSTTTPTITTPSTTTPTTTTTTTTTMPSTTTESTTESTTLPPLTTVQKTSTPDFTTTTTTPPDTTRRPRVTITEELAQGDQWVRACKEKPADVYFLLDASSSVYIYDFQLRALKFVRDLVSSFQISPTHTRVGLVTFSDNVKHEFGLTAHPDLESLQRAIQPDRVEYLTGGTNTGDAIAYVMRKAFGSKVARSDVPQIMITITDGLSQKPKKTARAATEARRRGIRMFAVGVGKNVDKNELVDISSKPSDDFVFYAKNFKALSSITEKLAQKTCSVVVAGGISDSKQPKLNKDIDCPNVQTSVVFTYTYLNSIAASRSIVQDVIMEFTGEVHAYAPHIKIGVVTQPCVGGAKSLMSVDRFQRAMLQIKSNYFIGYPAVVRKVRTEVISQVPDTENRITVMFVDEKTRISDHLLEEVDKLRSRNIRVIVVAVGEVDESLVGQLASGPNTLNVIHVDSYATLKEEKVDLMKVVCARVALEDEQSTPSTTTRKYRRFRGVPPN